MESTLDATWTQKDFCRSDIKVMEVCLRKMNCIAADWYVHVHFVTGHGTLISIKARPLFSFYPEQIGCLAVYIEGVSLESRRTRLGLGFVILLSRPSFLPLIVLSSLLFINASSRHIDLLRLGVSVSAP